MTDTTHEALPVLNPEEARILGCLAEKKELTPDIYPMTVNALQSAANQKTSREPVMAMEPADIQRTLRLLTDKGLVRKSFASRVERYEHLLANRFSLTQRQVALVTLLMLRGAQTLHELMARGERLARFQSVDEATAELDLLIGRRPPLVQLIERGPGQREDRYVHLLGGPAAADTVRAARAADDRPAASSGLEARIAALEAQVARLAERLDAWEK